MNKSSSSQPGGAARFGRRLSRWLAVGAVAVLVSVSGCGASGGALLYYMGVGQKQRVQAEYRLGEGPVLVLVDDFSERLRWPEVRDLLATATANELLDHEAAQKFIANDDVRQLRQVRSDFDDRGCLEIGRMLGADQVVWLEATDFFASVNMQDTSSAAWLAVTVKVIDANATERGSVRLWPQEREGYPLRVDLSSNEVSRAKTRPAIAKDLAAKMSREVARLFYDHIFDDLANP